MVWSLTERRVAVSTHTYRGRDGEQREMREPDAEPTFRQLIKLVHLLRDNPDVTAPRIPRTKAEASVTIDKLKKRVG